jgi:hypothetical protein
MPDVVLYPTYKEIFGKDIIEDDLINLVKPLSLNDCLQTIGKLSHLLSSDDPEALRDANRFVLAGLQLYGSRILAEGMVRVGRPLLFDKQLMTLARSALLHAEDRPPDSLNNGADRWRFVEALFGVLDIYGVEIKGEVRNGVEAEEWYSSFRLRRVGMPKRIARQSVVRSVRVFVDLPQQHMELVTTVPPAETFEAAVGMPLERYLAIAFAAITRFMTWDKKPDGWLLGNAFWANSTVTGDEFARSIGTVSATPSKLRGAFSGLLERGENGIDDMRPFLLHPLIELEPGIYSPVDVGALADNFVGDGLFWRLRPAGPNATDEERNAHGETLGHLFEQHCLEVAESVYPANAQPRRLYPEFNYSEGDGPDLIVADDHASAFVELGIGRPHLRNTLMRGDLASYDADVRRLIVPRAEQLDRKIGHALNGILPLQGAPPACLDRIHPVICLWDGYPLGRYLYQRIEKAVADAGYLQQPEVAPLSIISVQELEQLLGLVSTGETLTDILTQHVTGDLSDEPLNDFLHRTFGREIALPPVLTEEFYAIATRLAWQLFGDAVPPYMPEAH